jgi:hypothetical protein
MTLVIILHAQFDVKLSKTSVLLLEKLALVRSGDNMSVLSVPGVSATKASFLPHYKYHCHSNPSEKILDTSI